LTSSTLVRASESTADTSRQLFRIEHATSEILQQLTQSGVDLSMVRGLGSARDWRPNGMAEIELWLDEAELGRVRALGLDPRPIRDEAREMWRLLQEQPARERDYHAYPQLTSLLQAYAAAYPNICRLYSIGQSVQGRELWVMKVTDNPDLDEDEPEFKYIATMHGNEPLGTEMLLFLLEHLLVNYGDDPRITNLVDGMEIHLLPLMNPDGNTAGVRQNANGVDLNRNFPDPWNSPNNTPTGRQPETAAVMLWTQAKDFDLSANFHTGALLVNYPFDNNATGSSVYTASPDDDLFIQMSTTYSINNQPMYNGAFPNGISNGADWYAMSGGMQDWNYRWEGGMEVTVELSNTYWPDASQLPTYWNNNRESMLSYMEWALRGVRGIVTSAATGLPLPGVEVRVAGRDFATWSAAGVGDYHRLLPAGTYSLTFSKAGYQSQTLPSVVVGAGAAMVQHVSLQPLVAAPDFALGAVTVLDGENGRLDPGETALLEIALGNVGTIAATGLTGLLTSDSPWVTVNSGAQSYESLWPDQWDVASFSVTVDATAPVGESVAFTLTAVCDQLTEALPFALNVGLILEDFESGGFLAWPWVMGGNQPWTITTTSPYEGARAARSGVIGHNQSSAMSLTVEVATAGTLSFAARVSSEANYDFLRFSIDGAVQASWSGTQPWAVHSFPVTAGIHVLSWSYVKDNSAVGGEDAAWVDWISFPPMAPTPYPDWAVTPATVEQTLEPGGTAARQLHITNTGEAPLHWTASLSLDDRDAALLAELKLPKGVEDRRSVPALRNAGGPDAYGHTWMDSREPGGPAFSWVDISGTGINAGTGDDVSLGPFPLGFAFSYYGNSFDAVRICTNGFLSFTSSSDAYGNQAIPNSAEPNNLLAPFWDDLNVTTAGMLKYRADAANQRFIVSWLAVPRYNTTQYQTFQAILHADGRIVYQYQSMNGTLNSATVGMENATGTDGLQCVFNAAGFLVNNLAVQFTPPVLDTPWAVLSPLAGMVPAGGSAVLELALSAVDLEDGLYTGTVTLNSNDPDTPTIQLPLALTVSSHVDPVTDLAISVQGGTVILEWSAVPGAMGYQVQRSSQPWGGYQVVGATSTPGWSGPLGGDLCLFRVVATR
jgi:carboxypeptidase D